MINLPKWRMTCPFPAFLECESGTAIEMTAKLYGAMQELIEEYNAFVESTNTKINEFTATTTEDIETFKTGIRQEFQDFIDTIDLKVSQMENDFITNLDAGINEAFASGRVTLNAAYNEETESLDFNFGG